MRRKKYSIIWVLAAGAAAYIFHDKITPLVEKAKGMLNKTQA